MISIIVAVARNNAIGYGNKLLYWLPDDLKRFKTLTTGHTIIMGRKTFESLPKGALPNRRNIILTRNPDFRAADAEVFRSLADALAQCQPEEEVFIIGGESVYKEAIGLASRLYVTAIEDTPAQADAFFPDIDSGKWQLIQSIPHEADAKHEYGFQFNDYIKKGGE